MIGNIFPTFILFQFAYFLALLLLCGLSRIFFNFTILAPLCLSLALCSHLLLCGVLFSFFFLSLWLYCCHALA